MVKDGPVHAAPLHVATTGPRTRKEGGGDLVLVRRKRGPPPQAKNRRVTTFCNCPDPDPTIWIPILITPEQGHLYRAAHME